MMKRSKRVDFSCQRDYVWRRVLVKITRDISLERVLLSALLSLFIATFALSRCARVWKSNVSTEPVEDGETGEGLCWVWFRRTRVGSWERQYWM